MHVCVGLPGLKCSAALLAGSGPQHQSSLASIWLPELAITNKMYNNNLLCPSQLEKDLENKSIIRMGVKESRSETSNRRLGGRSWRHQMSTARACCFNTPPSADSNQASCSCSRLPAKAAEWPLCYPSLENTRAMYQNHTLRTNIQFFL